MGKFRGLDTKPGWIKRQFRDQQRNVKQTAVAARVTNSTVVPILTAILQQDQTGLDLGTGPASHCSATLTCPSGYPRAQLHLQAVAGVTLTDSSGGSVNAQPVVITPDGATRTGTDLAGGAAGPAPVSVTSPLAIEISGLVGGDPLVLRAAAYAQGTAQASSGHVHLTGTVLFLR